MNQEKTNHLEIQTPEGITFSLLLAGPITRFMAWLIDLACISTILTALGTIVALLRLISADAAFAALIFGNFVIAIGYGILCEWGWRGQTLGKRLFRLRVVDEQGLKLHFSQVVIRNLFRVVDSLPIFYMVGGVVSLSSRKAQRLGDLVANTVVIRYAPVFEPDFRQLMAGKYNSFRKYPHLCAKLRKNISPVQARIVLQALLKRNDLLSEPRVELFKTIADHLRPLAKFPEEAVEGLSDEQYVRNTVDVLYNRGPLK